MLNSMKWAVVAAALITVPASSAYAAMTADQCTDAFKKADADGDGKLSKAEGGKYEEMMTKNSVKTKDAQTVSMDEFMDSCTKGMFDNM
ncbi:EF-hand domain-containing protein [Aestuariivirga sp.]|uniref:EF-hand domain-containing protein n=1 Tax=Aestuariivirga sp. TaxID=2650926 RepID=UPI0039E6A632